MRLVKALFENNFPLSVQNSIVSDGTPLDFNAGYWAESFPSTENSLCAAIDPSREFRWHALNCNGPATSAFLCELPGK